MLMVMKSQIGIQTTTQQIKTTKSMQIATFIGRFGSSLGTSYFDGIMANIHFIDGQHLLNFICRNPQWGLDTKVYSGSYGTNGWHLDFADSSAYW